MISVPGEATEIQSSCFHPTHTIRHPSIGGAARAGVAMSWAAAFPCTAKVINPNEGRLVSRPVMRAIIAEQVSPAAVFVNVWVGATSPETATFPLTRMLLEPRMLV